jgi:hypothetical protein
MRSDDIPNATQSETGLELEVRNEEPRLRISSETFPGLEWPTLCIL